MGLKSTWLSFDAALQDLPSIRGTTGVDPCSVVLVYDMTGVGTRQLDPTVSPKLRTYQRVVEAVSSCHPSRIAKVVMLKMPSLAVALWRGLEPLLAPPRLAAALEFVESAQDLLPPPPHSEGEEEEFTTTENNRVRIHPEQLPVYLLEKEDSGLKGLKGVCAPEVVGSAVRSEWHWPDFHAYLVDRTKTDTLLY